MALAEGNIDPGSFTLIRLVSGAITLVAISLASTKFESPVKRGNWWGALALFVYAAGFSFAYQFVDTATGALLLFASVQLTMLITALFRGQRFGGLEWTGLIMAFSGFCYLMLPGASAPPVAGALLMVIAGVAWAAYTLFGAGSKDPQGDTCGNFLRASALSILLIPFLLWDLRLSTSGVMFAVLSGVFASGLGYTIWYRVLPSLDTSVAAVSQLSVPILAAAAGIMLLNEVITLRLGVSSGVIVAGILAVILARRQASKPESGG